MQIKEQQALLANSNHFSIKNLKRQLGQLEEQIQIRKLELQPEVDRRLAATARAGPSERAVSTSTRCCRCWKANSECCKRNLTLATEDLEKQLKEYDKLDIDTADLTNQESQLDDLQAIIKRVGTQLALGISNWKPNSGSK